MADIHASFFNLLILDEVTEILLAILLNEGVVYLQNDEGIHGGIVYLVLSQGSSLPVCQSLLFADLLANHFLANVTQI